MRNGTSSSASAPATRSSRAGTLAIGHASTVPVPVTGSGPVIVEFLADDPAAVDALHARLDDGTEVVQPPTDMPWGNRSLLLRDPGGVLVNVYAVLR